MTMRGWLRDGDTVVRPRVWFPAKILVSSALLWWVLTRVDFSQLLTIATAASPGPLIAAFLVLILCHLLNTVKWQLLSGAIGLAVPFGVLLRSYFAGLFASNFMPGVAGGDVVRVLSLSDRGEPLARVTSSVVIDRLVSLYVLLVVPGLCALFSTSTVPLVSRRALVLSSVLVLVAAAVSFTPVWEKAVVRSRLHRVTFIRELAGGLSRCRLGGGKILRAFGVGEASQLLSVLAFVLVSRSLGHPIGFWDAGLLTSVIVIGTMLPITVNGIGLRESLSVSLLRVVGMESEKALMFSFTIFVFGVLISLGGISRILAGSARISREDGDGSGLHTTRVVG